MALQVFTTIGLRSELYNYTTISHDRVIAVLGTSSTWDKPTELWTYDSTSLAVDDGVTVIKPTELLNTDPGRFIFKNHIVMQFGAKHSREWKGSTITSSSSVVFDISSAGFTNVVDWTIKVYLPGSGVTTFPIGVLSAKSLTSMTVTLVESKTTNTLLLSTTEGLELHAVAGTEVYLTVLGN